MNFLDLLRALFALAFTLGIIGLGRIGQQVAKRARAFDMQVVDHNRRRNEAAEAAVGALDQGLLGLAGALLGAVADALGHPSTMAGAGSSEPAQQKVS